MNTEAIEQVAEFVPSTDANGVFSLMSTALEKAGHQTPAGWITGMTQVYGPQVMNEEPPVARHVVNSYFHKVLGMHAVRTGADTTNARFCLEDHCSEQEWNDLITQIVAPEIVKFGL